MEVPIGDPFDLGIAHPFGEPGHSVRAEVAPICYDGGHGYAYILRGSLALSR